jgi:hypothetical protein
MNFEEWFKENKDRLEQMLRSDTQELVYECWLAGYKAGMREMSTFAADVFKSISSC